MALEKIGVEAVIEGLSSFRRGISQIDDGIDSVGKTSSKTTPKIGDFFKSFLTTGAAIGALTAVGKAVVDFSNESIQEFQQFENQAAEVFTLLPGLTQQATDQMKADILSFSAEAGRTTDETIPALYQAISAGVPQENVFDFLEVASNAARGGVTDLETAVDGITSVVNAYGDEVISAAQASDVMFTAVKLGKTNFEQLSSSLFNVIPTAASLGVSFEDVAASLAALTAQGTPTSVATTQLRAAFVEASKSGTKLDKALRDLTGKGFADLIASGMTSQQIFLQLRKSMPEQEFRDLFGSVEAGNAVLGITSETARTIIDDFGTLEDTMGATAKAAETMADTLEFAEQRAEATSEALKIQAGESLSESRKAWLNLKSAISESLSTELKQRRQIEETRAALEQFNITGVSADKAIGALGEGTLFWSHTLADAETMARRTDIAIRLLENGFTGGADALGKAVIAQEQMNLGMQYGNDLAMRYAQANQTLATSVQEVATELVYGSDLANQYGIAGQKAADASAVQATRYAALQESAAALAQQQAELNKQVGSYFNDALTATDSSVSLEMQMYNQAVAAGASAEELIVLAYNTGEFSKEQIDAAFQAALMTANIDALVVAMQAGDITARQATDALDLLKTGEATTAQEAIGLAESIRNTEVRMSALATESGHARDEINSIPREINIHTSYTTSGQRPQGGAGGEGAFGDTPFQMGGYTGRGPANGIAGTVHFGEVVLPQDILNKGANSILGFVNANLPGGIPSNVAAPPTVAPSMTSSNTTNKNINLSFPGMQVNNGMDVSMLGDFIVQKVAEAI